MSDREFDRRFLALMKQDKEGWQRWPEIYLRVLAELERDHRTDKIRALMTDPAATPGERVACEQALARLGET